MFIFVGASVHWLLYLILKKEGQAHVYLLDSKNYKLLDVDNLEEFLNNVFKEDKPGKHVAFKKQFFGYTVTDSKLVFELLHRVLDSA